MSTSEPHQRTPDIDDHERVSEPLSSGEPTWRSRLCPPLGTRPPVAVRSRSDWRDLWPDKATACSLPSCMYRHRDGLFWRRAVQQHPREYGSRRWTAVPHGSPRWTKSPRCSQTQSSQVTESRTPPTTAGRILDQSRNYVGDFDKAVTRAGSAAKVIEPIHAFRGRCVSIRRLARASRTCCPYRRRTWCVPEDGASGGSWAAAADLVGGSELQDADRPPRTTRPGIAPVCSPDSKVTSPRQTVAM